jgi:hypothetical protein
VFDDYGDDADDNNVYDSEALRIDCIYITVCERRGGEPRKHLRNDKPNPEFPAYKRIKSPVIKVIIVTPISQLKLLHAKAPHRCKPGMVSGYHVVHPFHSARIWSELFTDGNRSFQFVDELDSAAEICPVDETNGSQNFAKNPPRFETVAFLLVVNEIIARTVSVHGFQKPGATIFEKLRELFSLVGPY